MKRPSRGLEARTGRKRSATAPERAAALDRDLIPDQVLAELIRRVRDIETAYCEVAQKMGQLYMYADRHDLALLTCELDRPMRNASDAERTMASILEELKLNAIRRQQGGN
jgi:hypothetical protein